MDTDTVISGDDVLTDSAPASPDSFDIDPPYVLTDASLPADRFLDRELSWIAFNSRVLELAE